jgi:hypothetical protein
LDSLWHRWGSCLSTDFGGLPLDFCVSMVFDGLPVDFLEHGSIKPAWGTSSRTSDFISRFKDSLAMPPSDLNGAIGLGDPIRHARVRRFL